MSIQIRPVRTRSDYRAAVRRLDALMDAAPGSDAADELEVLAALVDRYEADEFPIQAPSPIEALRFRMEQVGLTRRDLEPLIGTRARVSEVLSGKRTLTLAMIRALHGQLGIPADALIGTATATRKPRRPRASRPPQPATAPA